MRELGLAALAALTLVLSGIAADHACAELPDQKVVVVDMDMQTLNRYSQNWQTATDWATQTVQVAQQEWLTAHPDGRVVLLLHSGASFVGDKLNQSGAAIDKAVYFSNGVMPNDFIANLQAAGLSVSNVLVVAAAHDIQASYLWPANGYDDRTETGVDYSFMRINDPGADHTTMVTWANENLSLTGTLPGLSPEVAVGGKPFDFVRAFVDVADPRPTLYVAIGGTNTDYAEGTAAKKLVDLVLALAEEQAGQPVGTSDWWVQPPGWSGTWNPPSTGGVGSGTSGGFESFPVARSEGPVSLVRLTSLQAEDLMPEEGLPGATTVTGAAGDAETIGGSRARARDYLIGGVIHATILGIETLDAPYAHSKVICDRFHGGELESVEAVSLWNESLVPGYWYRERLRNGDALEYSITFSVRYLGGRLGVACEYLPDYYAQPYPGEIITYQVWAATAEEAAMIVRGVLERASDFAPVDFENLMERIQPTVFARSARLAGGRLLLELTNPGPEQTVEVAGTTWHWDPADAAPASLELDLPVGDTSFALDVAAIRGAMLHTVVGGFLDAVYVAAPEWFAFDDSGSGGRSTVIAEVGPSDYIAPHLPGDYRVFGNARMLGSLDAAAILSPYAGMGAPLEARDRVADLSASGYVQFWAVGDGADYRVQVETTAVLDNDYHGLSFRAAPWWRPYTIPLSGLSQQGFGQLQAFDASRARSVVFLRLQVPGPYDLRVSEIRFASAGEWPALFADVPMGFWAATQIYALSSAGVVFGYTEDDPGTPESEATYQPGLPVTRAEMAVYVARALVGGDANVPAVAHEATFPDVPSDHWAFRYVECCYDANVVVGYWDGYHPTETVNRAQMAVYVARSIVDPTGEAGLAGYTPPAMASFSDVATDHWAYVHVEYCKAQSIVNGYWDGYHPDETVARDQMAMYVARAFQLPM